MQIEWCKARACAKCWEEEVELLMEEMRPILQFFKWEACHWNELWKECAIEPAEDSLREGLIAYAARQASLCQALSHSFSASWADTLAFVAKINHSLPNNSYANMDIDSD
ncbi:hypothetical protein K503DRAFT_704266 [Rhizopogon vinicolor AM-OR11-026]|uniref:Uncharacterized protein n=1 Tax=Rhizopogon vinicolor AM-OR11-026 TaxID=1314800 RepID=A0A1B7MEP6_9AGAM|nr:hypothetical protein K503DRAFT_704266 [Rhizopogon vinicolor AM-OR11-026]